MGSRETQRTRNARAVTRESENTQRESSIEEIRDYMQGANISKTHMG